ncbi:MAG TPA: DUF5658 family protein [Steroidobacteraceae bacterium]|nr:DUF5658 family protein [Steroidobacteraceae bacterium]
MASALVLKQLLGTRLPSPGVPEDRRRATDRRNVTLWSMIYGGFRPRRRATRRALDHHLPIVDWHESHLLAIAICILLLSFADAFLTLNLLMRGAEEANPFMAALFYHNVAVFTAVKMALTGGGVLLLVALSRMRLFGRIKVVQALYATLVIYVVLVFYELRMFSALT